MVSVPSMDTNWGVLVADRSSGSTNLTADDLAVLSRIGQQLGLILDKKQGDLTPQKPTEVPLSSKLVSGMTTFIHITITNYNEILTHYPTQATIASFNRFFSLVQSQATKKKNARLNSLLPNGAVISLSQHPDEPGSGSKAAVEFSLQALEHMEKINDDLITLGLPEVEIHIGIDTGPGITSVESEQSPKAIWGQSYDTAYRLVRLCNKFDTQIVISESVYQCLNETEKDAWNLSRDIVLKPIKHLTVARYKSLPQMKNEGGNHSEEA